MDQSFDSVSYTIRIGQELSLVLKGPVSPQPWTNRFGERSSDEGKAGTTSS